jgi:peroxiredoxin
MDPQRSPNPLRSFLVSEDKVSPETGSFGKRSWRYSMYVENGVIEKMFVE